LPVFLPVLQQLQLVIMLQLMERWYKPGISSLNFGKERVLSVGSHIFQNFIAGGRRAAVQSSKLVLRLPGSISKVT
jgi:hypothetical protein